MKRHFLLPIVALMAAAIMISGCKKDETDDESQSGYWYNVFEKGDPFMDGNGVPPSFDNNSYWGYNFDVHWSKANSFDTTKFVYELCWADKRDFLNQHSLGRQSDTVYHFSLDPNNISPFEYDTEYVLSLYAYYYYNNHEHQVDASNYIDFGIPARVNTSLFFECYDGNANELQFRFLGKSKSDIESISIVLCDIDNNNTITKTYNEIHHIITTKNKLVLVDKPDEQWSGTICIKWFDSDNNLRYYMYDKPTFKSF